MNCTCTSNYVDAGQVKHILCTSSEQFYRCEIHTVVIVVVVSNFLFVASQAHKICSYYRGLNRLPIVCIAIQIRRPCWKPNKLGNRLVGSITEFWVLLVVSANVRAQHTQARCCLRQYTNTAHSVQANFNHTPNILRFTKLCDVYE